MNKYQFHQAVVLKGKHFTRGIHEVSEVIENDAHFLKYVGVGYISEVGAAPVVVHQSTKEKADALLNKLRDKKVSKVSAPVAAEAPVAEEAPAEEEEEEDHKAGEKSPSHSSHKVHSKKKEK